MLWLLAALAVVTPLWGIAHRLKAGSTAPVEIERRSVNPATHSQLRNQKPTQHASGEE
jgi:hypothetical protein